mmetsp:Transcript_17852/g.27120  ORF Transcript_17852/g.27120 Transcript_17852/m.27120 type:complete len:402 (+) Transcript_17852:332-1537(+)
MVNTPTKFTPPNITQMRAFAFSAKPFALLSFLSSLWIIYSLLIRCGKKRLTMYHRLILSAAFCLNILSFCLFLGTWAMPVGTLWAVGAAGNENTCTAQGFLYDWAYVAFPFYYASFSVLALVSVKNNFKEEKYAWIEKWIHLGAYVPPLIFVIYATVKGWIKAGVALCTFTYYIEVNPDMSHRIFHKVLMGVQFVELLVATITIAYLWFNFTKIQSSIDAAIGMKKIKEEARKQRTRDVAIQSGIYLVSFWFMYIANIVSMFIYYFSDHMPYNTEIVANIITGTQGIILLGVYYGVKQNDCVKLPTRVSIHDERYDTVSKIRANATNQEERPRLSILNPYTFRIFDGTPAEDSPWAAFLEDDIESFDGDEINTQSSEAEGISNRALLEAENDLTTGLLSYN